MPNTSGEYLKTLAIILENQRKLLKVEKAICAEIQSLQEQIFELSLKIIELSGGPSRETPPTNEQFYGQF